MVDKKTKVSNDDKKIDMIICKICVKKVPHDKISAHCITAHNFPRNAAMKLYTKLYGLTSRRHVMTQFAKTFLFKHGLARHTNEYYDIVKSLVEKAHVTGTFKMPDDSRISVPRCSTCGKLLPETAHVLVSPHLDDTHLYRTTQIKFFCPGHVIYDPGTGNRQIIKAISIRSILR
jgi:hypothetical protein